MWYGLTKNHIVRGLIVFFGLGVFLTLCVIIFIQFSKSSEINYWALLFLLVALPGIWLVLVSVLTITWIKVNNDQVEYYLWKRIHILNCPIRDITHIGGGLVSAFIIKTKKGNMRLLGLQLNDKKKLSNHLMKINPNIQSLPSLTKNST